jgi:hypothetical protein
VYQPKGQAVAAGKTRPHKTRFVAPATPAQRERMSLRAELKAAAATGRSLSPRGVAEKLVQGGYGE